MTSLGPRLRTIFDQSPLGIGLADANGCIIETNPAYQRMLGYTADELRGMRFSELSAADDADENVRLFKDFVDGLRTSYAVEKTYRRKSGEPVRVRVTSAAVRDDHDRLAYSVAMVEDVTDMRRAEETLRDREALFRAVTEQTSELTTIVDGDGVFRYASPSVERVLGYGSGQLIGRPYPDLIHPDDIAHARERLESLKSSPGQAGAFTVRLQHADGSWRVLEGSATNLLNHPAVCGIVSSSRDVTERVTTAEDVRFQADLLDAVEQAVIAVDEAGCVTAWNRHAELMYGVSRANALGVSIKSLVQADSPDDTAWSDALANGGTGATERGIRRPDGSTFIVSATSSPISGRDGTPRGYVSVSRDITAQRSLEEQFRQAQKMEAVGRLAGGVAHDFNNLLTVIIAHADFLRRSATARPDMDSDITEIHEAAIRASSLTRQLLAFGRKQVLQPRTLNVNDVIDGIGSILERSMGEDIRVEMNLADDLPAVHADPGQLEQVIFNLAANARDAMPRGGVLSVTTMIAFPGESMAPRTTGEYSTAAHIALSIGDTGVGMDAATSSQIFEPFFTTKDPARGTGLGLSTVYGIVKQSGGTIAVDSRVGNGSTFTIYLPIAADEISPTVERAPGVGADPANALVLLVEDDPAVRRLTHRILSQHGYDVVDAESGPEALRVLRELARPISLLVTDVVMPDMSGRELSAAVLHEQPEAAVLFMSGYTNDEVFQRGLLPSGTSFLPKPFTRAALLAAVRDQLDGVAV